MFFSVGRVSFGMSLEVFGATADGICPRPNETRPCVRHLNKGSTRCAIQLCKVRSVITLEQQPTRSVRGRTKRDHAFGISTKALRDALFSFAKGSGPITLKQQPTKSGHVRGKGDHAFNISTLALHDVMFTLAGKLPESDRQIVKFKSAKFSSWSVLVFNVFIAEH